jgi:hypothetical protein
MVLVMIAVAVKGKDLRCNSALGSCRNVGGAH